MDSTLWAAVIAGLIACLSLIISKEQKISELRQEWIDALRAECAASISSLIKIHSYLLMLSDGKKITIEDALPDIAQLNISLNSLHMRLNPKNIDSKNLIIAIEDIENFFDVGIRDTEKLKNLINNLRPLSKIVLKNEWERSKKGEPWFRLSKAASIVIFLSAASYALINYIYST